MERVFDERDGGPTPYLRALRLHHWLKHLLPFAPLIAAHRVADTALLGQGLVGFIAFSLCASSVYLLNDLVDLESDRHHPRKRERPLAAGGVSLPRALGLGLLAAALATSLALPGPFVAVLAGYLALNVAYSLGLKSVAVPDVLVLAGLYTLRLTDPRRSPRQPTVPGWPLAWPSPHGGAPVGDPLPRPESWGANGRSG